MKELVDLENTGYTYSHKHKSLIFSHPSGVGSPAGKQPDTYHSNLLELYKATPGKEPIRYFELTPDMIRKGMSLTTQVIFEVTERCNLSCAYCALGDNYIQVSKERCNHMDWKTAKTALDYYIQIWKRERPSKMKKFCYIGFHGGEPLLNMPLVKKIISYLEKHSSDLDFNYAMTTNGTLLHQHIDYLIEKQFSLSVSMDGDRQMNSYRVYKNGADAYSDLYRNLKHIQTDHPEYFKEKVDFMSVATIRNTDEGIEGYFREEFGKKPQIHQLLSTMIANLDNWNAMRRKSPDRSELERLLAEDKKISILYYLRSFSGNFYEDYRSLLDDDANTARTPTGTCLPFSDRVFITVKRDIIACEKIGFERTIGKVTDSGIDVDFGKVADFYNSMYKKFMVQCQECYVTDSCDVCFLTNEQHFRDDFTCESFYPISNLTECIAENIDTLRNRTFDFTSLLNEVI